MTGYPDGQAARSGGIDHRSRGACDATKRTRALVASVPRVLVRGDGEGLAFGTFWPSCARRYGSKKHVRRPERPKGPIPYSAWQLRPCCIHQEFALHPSASRFACPRGEQGSARPRAVPGAAQSPRGAEGSGARCTERRARVRSSRRLAINMQGQRRSRRATSQTRTWAAATRSCLTPACRAGRGHWATGARARRSPSAQPRVLRRSSARST